MAAITYRTRVKKAEFRTRVARAWREGDDVRTEREPLGWGVLLDGSSEWLIFDADTGLRIGDEVEVSIRKLSDVAVPPTTNE